MLWKIIPKFRGANQKSTITINFNLDIGVTNKFMVDYRKLLDGL